MGSQPSTLHSRLRAKQGFALLITITLLAFIVLLLLGLAVYTRVETSIAGNTQRQAQARENALLALNVALAQLQKNAGADTRVTATAANFGAIDGTQYYTGVWTNNATTSTPLTWLVSGNEVPQADIPDPNPDAPEGSMIPAPLAITPAAPGNRTVTLVGRATTGSTSQNSDYVVAPLVDVTANGVPGVAPTAATTIGRYAWWVGDQGVKAPVAMSDPEKTVDYAPYDSAELRGRISQQIPIGAGAVDGSSGEPLFEPHDANNTPLMKGGRIAATNQLAFVRTPSNAALGLARVQQNFHAWSPANFAVLADTKNGGLRQDLSLKPDLLGAPFAAWANYPAYMEKMKPDPVTPPAEGETVEETPAPPTPTAPAIAPAYGEDPVRRRYIMTPHLMTGNTGGSHQVGPVLSDFALAFNVRTLPTGSGGASASPQPLEVRAALMLSLWNPYTAALVPEDIIANISGLPNLEVVREADGVVLARIQLQTVFGNLAVANAQPQFSFLLSWNNNSTTEGSAIDGTTSWLPGRVYTWRSIESRGLLRSDPFETRFDTRSFTASGESNEGIVIPLGTIVDGSERCYLRASSPPGSTPGALTVTLTVTRNGEATQLGQFISPTFDPAFETTADEIGKHAFQFGYVFRLKESVDTIATNPSEWLTSSLDLRISRLSGTAYRADQDLNPAVYTGSISTFVTAKPDRLLFRAGGDRSYNEDVPLFELPRAPILSVGALQHFRIRGSRAFMIGNPWGAAASLNGFTLNSLFDRFYFSGLVDGITPTTSATGDLVLPNPLLKPLRKVDGTKVTADDVRATAIVPEPTEPPTDGTTPDTTTPDTPPPDTTTPEPPSEPTEETPPTETTPTPAVGDARSSKYFLQAGAFNLNSVKPAAWAAVLRGVRFPEPRAFSYLDVSSTTGTAEDTALASISSSDAHFFRFPQSAQETYKADAGQAGSDAETISPANTHLFRRGVRTLNAAQVAALAAKIVELIGLKHAAAEPAGGPFRSIEEFLAPSDLFAGVDAEGNPGAARSLLEAAIADAGINADVPEFSSQWLTQGDLMTSLAPILFARSDTFVIRTYGEAVNPAKLPVTYRPGDAIPADAIEGKAWAEAIVQRLPEYFDRSDPPETLAPAFDTPSNAEDPESLPTQAHQLNKLFGRRFKVVSFRWLTRSDI